MGRYIKWDFTNKCNLRCIHCLAGKNYFADDVRQLPLADKLTIVDRLAEAEISGITFLGGEPLVSKDIFVVLQYAASKGIAVTLVTNGTLLDQTRISKLTDAGVQNVTVSLDGASSATHNQIRGDKSFERTVANIGKLVMHVRATGAATRVKVNTVVNRINRGETDAMFELGRTLGIDELSLLSLSEIGRVPDHRDTLVLTASEMIDVAIAIGKKFASIDKACYPAVTQQIAYPLVCDYIKQEHGIDMPKSNVSNICCFGAISLGYVTPDGYLFPCDRIVSDNYVGRAIRGATVERKSLLSERVDDIWNTDYFARMFELVVDEATYSNYRPCQGCKYLRTRECNPCPLYSMRQEVSIGTCLIAAKHLRDCQCAIPTDDAIDSTKPLFSGFSNCKHDPCTRGEDSRRYEDRVPVKAPGIRSFNKNGATVIFNPCKAQYCRLEAVGKFVWELVNGNNSVGEIILEVEDVISQVKRRVGVKDDAGESDQTTRQRVAAYFDNLSAAGFVSWVA